MQFQEITLLDYGRPLTERLKAREYVGPFILARIVVESMNDDEIERNGRIVSYYRQVTIPPAAVDDCSEEGAGQ